MSTAILAQAQACICLHFSLMLALAVLWALWLVVHADAGDVGELLGGMCDDVGASTFFIVTLIFAEFGSRRWLLRAWGLGFALGQLSIGNVTSRASPRSSASSICTVSTLSRRSSWRHSGTTSYPCGWFCMDCSGVRSRSPWDGLAGCDKASSLGTRVRDVVCSGLQSVVAAGEAATRHLHDIQHPGLDTLALPSERLLSLVAVPISQ